MQKDNPNLKPKPVEQTDETQYLKGRGAQINTKNRFQINEQTKEHIESIDDWTETDVATQYLQQQAKTIVNKVESPDVGMMYSMNRTPVVSMAAFTAMPVMCMNTGATAPVLILSGK